MLKQLKSSSHNQKSYSSIDEVERNNLYNSIHYILKDPSPYITSKNDREIIKYVNEQIQQHNLNNITRTNAYLHFFNEHNEIHWAFLAHMVSRNGGYSMTDLKGSLIGRFLDHDKKEILFQFLERANALIFKDAYPQLLLYKQSIKERKSYFHLLPAFQVSKFMIPIWQFFMLSSNSQLLTHALITNEQHYVERYLMSLQATKETIFNTLTYVIQEKMGFTHVTFPYKRYPFLRFYSLTGIEVHSFSSVLERIKVGKQLYSILFSKDLYNSILKFANETNHTGSRSDYWPHLFTENPSDFHKIYSPTLLSAWENKTHTFNLKQDWFTSFTQVKEFENGIKMHPVNLNKDIKRDLKLLMALGKIREC